MDVLFLNKVLGDAVAKNDNKTATTTIFGSWIGSISDGAITFDAASLINYK